MDCHGNPSASEYRKGCRCTGCKEAIKEYTVAYRQKAVILAEQEGAQFYHSHKGRPGAQAARRYGCTHPTCLRMAGLYQADDGTIRRLRDDAVPSWMASGAAS